MSYVRPDSDDANAIWFAAPAYTRPASDAADVNFSAASGGPTVAIHTGFSSTQFGTPSQPRPVTRFGTPTARFLFVAEGIGATPRFGTPATPVFSVLTPSGFLPTQFGVGYGLQPFQFGPEAQTAAATGFRLTAFGLPTSSINTTSSATGWASPTFGSPASRTVGVTEGFSTQPTFGTPISAGRFVSSGWRHLSWGTTNSVQGCSAHGFLRTRYGTPRSLLPGARTTTGWMATAFGRPSGGLRPDASMAEGAETTQFGLAQATNWHKALTLGPTTRLGRPTARRTPAC